jgi:hypothetical protein
MKKLMVVCLILIIAFAFMSCQKPEEDITIEPDFKIEGQVVKFSMMLDNKYTLKNQETYDIFFMSTYEAADGKQIRVIEEEAPGYTVDEAYLEEELTAIEEIITERTEILDVAGFGKLYGALLEDHTLGDYMFYYKFNVGEDVVTVLFHNKKKFTSVDEASVKRMISTVKSEQ